MWTTKWLESVHLSNSKTRAKVYKTGMWKPPAGQDNAIASRGMGRNPATTHHGAQRFVNQRETRLPVYQPRCFTFFLPNTPMTPNKRDPLGPSRATPTAAATPQQSPCQPGFWRLRPVSWWRGAGVIRTGLRKPPARIWCPSTTPRPKRQPPPTPWNISPDEETLTTVSPLTWSGRGRGVKGWGGHNP